jgi:hypothetical protein
MTVSSAQTLALCTSGYSPPRASSAARASITARTSPRPGTIGIANDGRPGFSYAPSSASTHPYDSASEVARSYSSQVPNGTELPYSIERRGFRGSSLRPCFVLPPFGVRCGFDRRVSSHEVLHIHPEWHGFEGVRSQVTLWSIAHLYTSLRSRWTGGVTAALRTPPRAGMQEWYDLPVDYVNREGAPPGARRVFAGKSPVDSA